MSEKLTREEIERKLEQTSDSISKRVGALERVVKPGGGSMTRRIAGMGVSRFVSIAVGSLAIGWIATSIARRIFGRSRNREDWAEDVAEQAMRERDRGADERTALERAIRDRAGSVPDGTSGRSGGLMSFVMGYAVRTGVHSLISMLLDKWAQPDAESGEIGADE